MKEPSNKARALAAEIEALSPGDQLRLAAGILDAVKAGGDVRRLETARLIAERVSLAISGVQMAYRERGRL